MADTGHFALGGACAVVESFYRARIDKMIDDYPFSSTSSWREYFFNDPATRAKTNCLFSDGTVVTWRRMSRDGVKSVAMQPDLGRAAIAIHKGGRKFHRHVFTLRDERWVHEGYFLDRIIG